MNREYGAREEQHSASHPCKAPASAFCSLVIAQGRARTASGACRHVTRVITSREEALDQKGDPLGSGLPVNPP